jgi:prephenate dehydrogenase
MQPTIGIIGGRGILGKVFRKAFEDAGFDVLISGRKPDGKKVLSNKVLARKADIVIVSVFLKDTEKVLREITPILKKNQLLCDFTSVKEFPLEAMKKAKSEVVGLHPMFGDTENLAGKNIFACKVRSGTRWKQLSQILKNLGLNIHEVSAKRHDELSALHQASAQLLSLAFALLLKKKKITPQKLFEIASPSTQLALLTSGRILSQDLEMYTDIQLLNPQVKKTVVELAEILANLACDVAGDDRKTLLKSFRKASKFFGKWSDFAAAESSRVFENLSGNSINVTNVKSVTTPLSRGDVSRAARNGGFFLGQRQMSLQAKNSIAVFGTNSQTTLAAENFAKKTKISWFRCGRQIHLNHCSTITEIFEKVLKGKAKIGFVPLENFSIGPVRETMRALFEARGKIKIFASSERRIEHSLLGVAKIPLRKVVKVFAHPQAIAQCSKFLQKNLAKAEIVEVANAGVGIEQAKREPNTLAISSAEFAKSAGIKVVKKGIEDSKNNKTRFVAVCKTSSTNVSLAHQCSSPPDKGGSERKRAGGFSGTPTSTKTALAFFFAKNKAGQLAAALDIFAEHKINLSRIESIPTEKRQGEFFFFTECEKSKNLPNALRKLSKIASVVELGSY